MTLSPLLCSDNTGPCALVSNNLQFMKNVEPLKMEVVIVLVLERQGGKIQLEYFKIRFFSLLRIYDGLQANSTFASMI